MGLRLEYEGTLSANAIGVDADGGHWPNAKESFNALEHVFAIIFLLELMLRLKVRGCTYFKQAINWIDFVVVSTSLLELFVFERVGADFPNLTFMRLLRIFKIIRVLRIVRVLKFFENLRILVAAVVYSMRSLLWSMLLLGTIQLIASIFLTQSLQSYLQDASEDPVVKKEVYEYFGSFSRSCITLFEMTLAIGTWGKCGRMVIFSVNRWYCVFFFSYLALVSFAMIRVIAAIFLKDTLASAAKDNEKVMAEVNKDPKYVTKIWTVFCEMDINGDGVISVEELALMLQDDRVRGYLKRVGVVPEEVKGLFELMDDGDNAISFCEFIAGIMRLKNASKGVDLVTLLYENKKVLNRVLDIRNQVDDLRNDLTCVKPPSNCVLPVSGCLANGMSTSEPRHPAKGTPVSPPLEDACYIPGHVEESPPELIVEPRKQ
eukprot:gnl/MRDRNA2_/MRDRNA2_147969_c1_seq1.p1 gnl/MRDRNA2_/MRDRNA2_147969_c1~~gnl/MRDRNA2_/MRDRNA2_147969_c1_seq1.p1  ORF type:complete len:489 (+),score=80.21 gnl/MRDRNA2_/MRDRNA2_147969_c1_seq1:173-1468(+)